MRIVIFATSFLMIAILATMAFWSWPVKPTVASLENQLSGSHCRDQYDHGAACYPRETSFWQWLLLSQAECDLWAIQCLGEIQSEAAHQTLIRILTTKTDVETCDGVLPVRSTAVWLLGKSGQPSAMAPLQRT